MLVFIFDRLWCAVMQFLCMEIFRLEWGWNGWDNELHVWRRPHQRLFALCSSVQFPGSSSKCPIFLLLKWLCCEWSSIHKELSRAQGAPWAYFGLGPAYLNTFWRGSLNTDSWAVLSSCWHRLGWPSKAMAWLYNGREGAYLGPRSCWSCCSFLRS